MIQIPYDAVGIGIGIILGVWALVQAESAGGRVLIAGLMLAIFFLPAVWGGPGGHLARLIAWVVFGIGCYVYIKLRGVPLR
ncbi:MAG TPA: hypothetical protein VMS75_09030 [Terriglobales bacterium]|nr:hypothetical protein [Terriglobales bacterium]